MLKSRERDSVVKIDSLLLEAVENFIKKRENRLRFSNKKQFIDIAVDEFLNKQEKESKEGKDEKK